MTTTTRIESLERNLACAAAKRLIESVMDAMYDVALAGCQDGGEKVDILWSRLPGRQNEVMSIKEAEQRLNIAIRAAWRDLTGLEIDGDPWKFIKGSPYGEPCEVPLPNVPQLQGGTRRKKVSEL